MKRSFARDLWKLVRWEWRLESKGYETLSSMVLFSAVTLGVFSLAIDAGALGTDGPGLDGVEDPFDLVRRKVQSGILWVTLVTSASIGIDRTWRGGDASLTGLLASAIDRRVIYYARFTATLLFVAIMAALTGIAFSLLYPSRIGLVGYAELVTVVGVGLIGVVAVGVTLGLALRSIRGGDVLLRILLFPLVVPVFLAGVDATTRILGGQTTVDRHWTILASFAVIYVMLGQILVDRVLDEPDAL